TRGRERHLALGNAIAQIVHHQRHGIDHVVEVEQGLAHAHHHHVGDRPVDLGRYGAEGFVGDPHLADDLGGGQVAAEALLAGGADTAVQRAAGLGGYTEGATPVLPNVDSVHVAA